MDRAAGGTGLAGQTVLPKLSIDQCKWKQNRQFACPKCVSPLEMSDLMFSAHALCMVGGKGDFLVGLVLHHVVGHCLAYRSHLMTKMTSSYSEDKNTVLGMV
jgi:hypothetical protein